MSINLDRFTLPDTVLQIEALAQRQEALKNHKLFGMIKTVEDLRVFMQMHVYAVWDFMSLLKRIQTEYTGYRFPWTPPLHPKLARIVNEIVLAEESDDDGNGGHCSHFDLYVKAMGEVGIDLDQINEFVHHLRFGLPPAEAAGRALRVLPTDMKNALMFYIGDTYGVVREGVSEEVLAYFLFGREDPIPAMFSQVLENLGDLKEQAPTFVHYLKRHIEVDGDEHGPAAARLLEVELEGNAIRTRTALNAGIRAIDARIALWDAVVAQLEKRQADTATA